MMVVLPSEVLVPVAISAQDFRPFCPWRGSIVMIVVRGMLFIVVVGGRSVVASVVTSRMVKVSPFEVFSRCGRKAGLLIIRRMFPAVECMLGRRVA